MFRVIKMSIEEIRRRNLQQVIDERFDGVIRRFSIAIDRQDQVIGRYLHKNPERRKNLGSDMCRHIEATLGLEQDWMDREHSPSNLDRASQELKERFSDLAIRPVYLWQQIEQLKENKKETEIQRVFAMPAAASSEAFFLILSSPVSALRAGDMVAVDPKVEPSPGQWVVANILGSGWVVCQLQVSLVPNERRFTVGTNNEISTSNFIILGTVVLSVSASL